MGLTCAGELLGVEHGRETVIDSDLGVMLFGAHEARVAVDVCEARVGLDLGPGAQRLVVALLVGSHSVFFYLALMYVMSGKWDNRCALCV